MLIELISLPADPRQLKAHFDALPAPRTMDEAAAQRELLWLWVCLTERLRRYADRLQRPSSVN